MLVLRGSAQSANSRFWLDVVFEDKRFQNPSIYSAWFARDAGLAPDLRLGSRETRSSSWIECLVRDGALAFYERRNRAPPHVSFLEDIETLRHSGKD
jgi:hypothetical protein